MHGFLTLSTARGSGAVTTLEEKETKIIQGYGEKRTNLLTHGGSQACE